MGFLMQQGTRGGAVGDVRGAEVVVGHGFHPTLPVGFLMVPGGSSREFSSLEWVGNMFLTKFINSRFGLLGWVCDFFLQFLSPGIKKFQ